MKVLLVEDDPVTQHTFAALLRQRGHEVTACAAAEDAWEICQQELYPLLILDWILPDMDGLQLCRQVRALPGGDACVILVATVRAREEHLLAVLDAGADDYLAKPVDLGLFEIRLAIAEQRVRDRLERKLAETRIAEMFGELEKSREDLLAILNQMRVGTAITDREGRITFLSQTARGMFLGDGDPEPGQSWEALLPLREQDRAQLRAMSARPPEQRVRVSAFAEGAQGQRYWVDIDVQDDPRDPHRKIFFFYDMSEVYDLRRQLDAKAQFHDLVGKSKPMQQVYQQIREVAGVDATVLIEGETGTGKELVARAIHASSHRRDKPFIAMNCAGLTESLINSQLFGHRRGAFTGAVEDHKGFLEAADTGTLLLDEVGDIPLSIQASLLRVLQEKEITPLGESRPQKLDVRILASTHRDLHAEVQKGSFRQDLLYRIRIARIELPPLRQRREDIPALSAAFLRKACAVAGRDVPEVSQEAMRLLMEYPWPGNVRELENAIEHATIRTNQPMILPADLPPELRGTAPLPDPGGRILRRARKNGFWPL